jgi:hypothetical protein
MNMTLLWMLMLPVIGAAILYYLNREKLLWWQGLVAILPGMVLVGIIFAISHGSAVVDTEIWNGQVTAKERKHGDYKRPYDCNCRSVESCSGSGKDRRCSSTRKCDTCYEDRYTVHWNCSTTIGGFTIDSRDTTSRSVYLTPDPARYTSIQVGDPASKTSSYTNYVQAVPNSLFHAAPETLRARFATLLLPYPDKVYDFYRLDRFVTPGFSFTDAAQWNQDISLMLRELGPKKQVNVIVVVAKTADLEYEYALRDHWEGVNKNDVVLLIGSTDGQKIEFARVISWTKSELFKIELSDAVRALGVIDRTQIIPLVSAQIGKNFERRRMREFEYLSNEIDPPTWLIVTLLVLLLGGYGGVTYALRRAR